MAAVASWLDDLDLHAGPPSMGVRALDDAQWLAIDGDWPVQRAAARRSLASDRRREVLAGRADAAALELGARLDAWLAARHPELADGAHAGELDALAAARSRVAEDLCVLTPGWVLAAGAVCFPSYWRLGDKVGRPLAAVHGPVPGYAGALAGRVDAFLDRLRPGRGVWRRNWSIHATADLFVPVPPAVADERAVPPPARWFRSEYQTLVRLASVDAVVFTIRTQQLPVAELATRPDVCAALAAVLRAWTPAQRSYKGGAVDGALVEWLERCAGAP